MKKPEILITGAGGEIAHSLIHHYAAEGKYDIVAWDLREPDPEVAAKCKAFYRGNILDRVLISEIETQHEFEIIFHLASLLSTSGERNPKLAHEVNVDGSLNMLQIAQTHTARTQRPTTFMFASSIAAYGIRPGDDNTRPVGKRQYLTPVTMYGINKLYVENIGRYYSLYMGRGEKNPSPKIDFRSVRFPGLISPDTMPTGGTTDYGPEMLHAAAEGVPYQCFVREDTYLPFMVMSDGVKALDNLARSPADQVKHRVYNVTAFSVTAGQIRDKILSYYPKAQISFESNPMRQAIVDSWPAMIDDNPAREDWDWSPDHDFDSAFDNVLIPKVKTLYG